VRRAGTAVHAAPCTMPAVCPARRRLGAPCVHLRRLAPPHSQEGAPRVHCAASQRAHTRGCARRRCSASGAAARRAAPRICTVMTVLLFMGIETGRRRPRLRRWSATLTTRSCPAAAISRPAATRGCRATAFTRARSRSSTSSTRATCCACRRARAHTAPAMPVCRSAGMLQNEREGGKGPERKPAEARPCRLCPGTSEHALHGQAR